MHLVTEFFHSLPHLNMWFLHSNSSFDPTNSDYLETILFWTTVPILVLIFILLVLIIYACCLVCISNTTSIKVNQSNNVSSKKKSNLNAFKTFVWIFIILLCALLGFLVYGSENFHYSFHSATKSFQNFSDYFLKLGQQAKTVQNSIRSQINTTLARFEYDLRNSTYPNLKQKTEALKELSNIRSTLFDSQKSLDNLRYYDTERTAYFSFLHQIEMFEAIRWPIMLGFVVVNTFLILLLMIGLIKNSKASLCFFAFSGVLSLISIWILNAFYLGITVFLADYCVAPDQFITTFAEKKQTKNIVQYFTTCRLSSNRMLPFKQDLNRADTKLNNAKTMYTSNLIKMSEPILGEHIIESYNLTDALYYTETLLDSLGLLIKCEETSSNYKQIVNILCYNSILNLAIIIASSISFGLIIPILICIIPQMWRKMNTKSYYSYNGTSVDESHPFISMSNTGGINGGGGGTQVRTNISAARQFNESPSFQRLITNPINDSSLNTNTTQQLQQQHQLQQNAMNTLSRNRFNTLNNRVNTNNNNNHHHTMNRIDDCMLNNPNSNDHYMSYKNTQTMSHNNYSQSNYGNYGNYGNYATANTSAVNVPIVLYPNSSNGTRTLLMSKQNNPNTDYLHKNLNNYQ